MIAVVLLAAAVQAVPPPPVVVTVAVPEKARLVAGGSTRVRVVATIKKGFHIQANPASEPYLVPARLRLREDDRVRVGPVEYPPGKPHRLRGTSSDLSVYEGTFVILVSLEAPRSGRTGALGGELILDGTLEYQACNNVMCLKPSSAPARVPVKFEPEHRR